MKTKVFFCLIVFCVTSISLLSFAQKNDRKSGKDLYFSYENIQKRMAKEGDDCQPKLYCDTVRNLIPVDTYKYRKEAPHLTATLRGVEVPDYPDHYALKMGRGENCPRSYQEVIAKDGCFESYTNSEHTICSYDYRGEKIWVHFDRIAEYSPIVAVVESKNEEPFNVVDCGD